MPYQRHCDDSNIVTREFATFFSKKKNAHFCLEYCIREYLWLGLLLTRLLPQESQSEYFFPKRVELSTGEAILNLQSFYFVGIISSTSASLYSKDSYKKRHSSWLSKDEGHTMVDMRIL